MIVDRMRAFNLRELRAHPGRTSMSLVVVGISATLLVAVLGIAGSITGSSDRLVAGIGGNAALEVSGVTDTGFPEAVRTAVANVTGVAAAVPMLRTSVGKPSERVLLLGVDDNVRAMLSDLQRAVQDQIGPLVTQPGRVAVGAGTGYAQGDSVSVGNGKVTVAAVIGGPDAERINGANFIVGPLPLIQRLTDRVGHDRFGVGGARARRRSRERSGGGHRRGGRASRGRRTDLPVRAIRWARCDHAHPHAVCGVERTRGRRIPDLQCDEHGDHATAPADLDASCDRCQAAADGRGSAGGGRTGGAGRWRSGIGARCAGRQAGDRPAARGVVAGIRVANRVHPAPVRDSGWRGRVRRHERCGGGAGGPPGVQGAAGRSPRARRDVHRRCRRASGEGGGGCLRRRVRGNGDRGRLPRSGPGSRWWALR